MVNDEKWMQLALDQARLAREHDEVPVGAVIIYNNEVIGTGWNQPISSNDPTAHAEIVALRVAAKTIQNYRIPGASMFVTLEPCAMCAGAIIQARLQRLIFAVADLRSGAAGSVFNVLQNDSLNHRTEISANVLSEPCRELIQSFFKERRASNND